MLTIYNYMLFYMLIFCCEIYDFLKTCFLLLTWFMRGGWHLTPTCQSFCIVRARIKFLKMFVLNYFINWWQEEKKSSILIFIIICLWYSWLGFCFLTEWDLVVSNQFILRVIYSCLWFSFYKFSMNIFIL